MLELSSHLLRMLRQDRHFQKYQKVSNLYLGISRNIGSFGKKKKKRENSLLLFTAAGSKGVPAAALGFSTFSGFSTGWEGNGLRLPLPSLSERQIIAVVINPTLLNHLFRVETNKQAKKQCWGFVLAWESCLLRILKTPTPSPLS